MHALAMTILPSPLAPASGRPSRRACFASHDGVSLFYRHWPVTQGSFRRAVVLLHRPQEHSGRIEYLVEELGLEDFSFFAWDARGHGCSPGERGDSPGLASALADLDKFLQHVVQHHGIPAKNIAVIAQGGSAVLAAKWVRDYAPSIRCFVLAAPAFRLKRPFGCWAIERLYAWRGNFFVTSSERGKHLTHDPERIAAYDRDLLVNRRVSARMLLGLHDAAEQLLGDAQAIRLPVQLLVSGADRIAYDAPQQRFFDNLGSTDKEMHRFEGFYHDVLGERDRQPAIRKVRDFLARQFSTPRHGSGRTVDRTTYAR
jgi:alpha-beta hydrolase superfamily lysophospholipase